MMHCLASILLLFSATLVSSDFGDYADNELTCPFRTTCPVVCVSDASACPKELICSDGETLCVDGTCAPTGAECPGDLSNPCEENVCLNTVACPKIDMLHNECLVLFESYYSVTCPEEEERELLSWTAPGFTFCYAWISVVSVLIIGWCAFNQRFFPIGYTHPLKGFSESKSSVKKASYKALAKETKEKEKVTGAWTQTAYRKTILGTFIYTLVVITMFGFQVLLIFLTTFYYTLYNDYKPVNPFEDELQVLLVFEIVWMVAVVWCLIMKWPANVRSLFLRRCNFEDADFVAVFVPMSLDIAENTRVVHVVRIRKVMSSVFSVLNSFLAFLFSDFTHPGVRGSFTYCPVKLDKTGHKSFSFRLRRYAYDQEQKDFVPGNMQVGKTVDDFIRCKNGLTTEETEKRIAAIGPNCIPMPKPSLLRNLFHEYSKIFYLYQNFMAWTWLNLDYWYMGVTYTITYLLGGLSVSFVKYQNDCNLYKLGIISGTVEALRDGKFQSIPQQDLAPGDIITVVPGSTYCDMVLISAENVLVDESALTGEATPVAKTHLDPTEGDDRYDSKVHKKNTIAAGSIILESSKDGKDLAVVTQTGSFTTKGRLLRDILFYERHQFKFDVEIEIVILILIFYAVFTFSITVYLLADDPIYGWFYGMFVVSAALPQLLPTVFVVSVGISANRLIKKRIACSDSHGILVAGKVSVAFFDKTGTLTKQGLDFLSSENCDNGRFKIDGFAAVRGMAVCHTLTKSSEGTYVGNSVDATMFEASGASLDHPKGGSVQVTEKNGQTVTILKRFEFDHARMTQSVLVQDENSKLKVYVKGSAESIKKLCKKETIPTDFDDIVQSRAREGIYQISIATRDASNDFSLLDTEELNLSQISRDEIERDLTFAGFVNFKNILKEDTCLVLDQLAKGDVRTIMVTGDNVLTGIHIAKESRMIEPEAHVIFGHGLDVHGDIVWKDGFTENPVTLPSISMLRDPSSKIVLAVTGDVWSALIKESIESAMGLAQFIRVYGRCTPNDKVSVVTSFVQSGYITLMCGDGGNDCGALKTAHVGIALSDAEASVVSPFTSLDKSIMSVVEVLKEGRCALSSAFSTYKFMIMYGQVVTINQVANAYFAITFSEWCWIFMDGIWVLTLAFTLPNANIAKKLSPERPTSSLLGLHTMSSSVGLLLINFLILVFALIALEAQDWYQCRKWGSTDVSNLTVIGDNYESTVIWLITGFQLINSAMAYNFGFTHRAAWIWNWTFVIFAVGWTIIHYIVTLVPSQLSCLFRINCDNENVVPFLIGGKYPIYNPWNTTVMPLYFRWTIVALMTANLILNMSWEYFVVNGILKKLSKKMKTKRVESQKAIEELVEDTYLNEKANSDENV